MTGVPADPLRQMHVRAKRVWTACWILLAVLVTGQVTAFSTGWIYGNFLTFATLPAGCFIWLAAAGLGSHWALNCVPEEDRRLVPRLGPFTRKVLLMNVVFVLVGAAIWAGMDRSPRPLMGSLLILGLGGLLMLGLWAALSGAILATLYTRRVPDAVVSSSDRDAGSRTSPRRPQ